MHHVTHRKKPRQKSRPTASPHYQPSCKWRTQHKLQTTHKRPIHKIKKPLSINGRNDPYCTYKYTNAVGHSPRTHPLSAQPQIVSTKRLQMTHQSTIHDRKEPCQWRRIRATNYSMTQDTHYELLNDAGYALRSPVNDAGYALRTPFTHRYLYIYVYIYAYMYVFVLYTYTYVYLHIRINIHALRTPCTHRYLYIHICNIYICICIYLFYTHTYVYLYICINTFVLRTPCTHRYV